MLHEVAGFARAFRPALPPPTITRRLLARGLAIGARCPLDKVIAAAIAAAAGTGEPLETFLQNNCPHLVSLVAPIDGAEHMRGRGPAAEPTSLSNFLEDGCPRINMHHRKWGGAARRLFSIESSIGVNSFGHTTNCRHERLRRGKRSRRRPR